MKVISINLHLHEESDQVKKHGLLADFIVKEDIDIVFLQEICETTDENVDDNTAYNLCSELNRRNTNYYIYVDNFKFPKKHLNEGVAILSKYKITSPESIIISNTIDENHWQLRKFVTGIIEVDSKKYLLGSVHLGWSTKAEKVKHQINNIKNKIKEHDNIDGVIIGGDFNCPPVLNNFKYLESLGLTNCALSLGVKKPTLNIFLSKILGYNFFMLDHIYVSGVKPVKFEVLFNKKKISDHSLLFTELEVL